MDDAEAALQQQLPAALRQLQPTALQAIHHTPQAHHGHGHGHGLAGQLPPELHGLDPVDANAFQQRLQVDLQNAGAAFDQDQNHHHAGLNSRRALGDPQTPQSQRQRQQHHGGQFGVLTPAPALAGHALRPNESLSRLREQPEQDLFQTPDCAGVEAGGAAGHIDNLKIVPHPPNLQEWRKKLFDVNDTITLSEDEFQIYFPHVDNIYSHRSTQRYKRKPFVSHYWDCRLKGRPPGTPKSEDPNKKKRKRTARQRDLCDVKIKITEYFPGAMLPADFSPSDKSNNFFAPGQPGGPPLQQSPPFGALAPSAPFPGGDGVAGQRYYTVQRVNGNGGNGKGDGVAGPHKHSLEDSDKVKKNSVLRYMLKEEKQKKKTQKSEQKTYHKRATGLAMATVKKHSKEHELKLYGSCFCPFVQRVWIALEAKGVPYQYVEVDPYKKPDSLLEINPRGLVPALRHRDWGCYESTVLMEYLEDLDGGSPLLPLDEPQLRAHCRLWSDHINRNIVPLFYRCLQAQEVEKQVEHAEELKTEISKLVDVADLQGPYFLGPDISFVDIQFAPWMLRLSRVLKPYRGWPDPEAGSRWGVWLAAIEGNDAVKATLSTDDLYLDSYERYAENRHNTSQLANAVNSGRGLP
ncbi:MAG: hypothetical protein M1832_005215 [Thelocarpon impressellum]|nr:MAG: hypothetical protein M1832_005215 [Thelocarpon impressellum]